MTTHLDDELLAQWVIDGETPDDAAADHLRLCGRCRESLQELRVVAGHIGELPRLDTAPADVWDRIGAELGFEPGTTQARRSVRSARSAPSAVPSSVPDASVAELRPRRRPVGRTALAIAASIAAVVGIGVGAIGRASCRERV